MTVHQEPSSATSTEAEPTPALSARRPNGSGSAVAGRIVLVLLIIVALGWTLAPIAWMFLTSLKSTLEVARIDPTLWPETLTGENYAGLFGGSLPFSNFLISSFLTSGLAALSATALSVLAGYSFARGRWRLRAGSEVVVLATQMLPLVVLIGPLYLVLLEVGLLDTYLGLIIGYATFTIPFGAWMMKGFFEGMPIEIEEAARVDGFSRIYTLFRIVLPLTLSGVVTTFVFIFMNSWNNLLYPLTLMTSPDRQTLPPGLLLSFTGQLKTDWAGMMAAACLTSLPLVVAFFAIQRHMVRGLTSGAVAGS